VWTAPSPSQIPRSRSPSLPPLPKFESNSRRPHGLDSPPGHQRSDSSAYYTALWGSPYEASSSAGDQLGGHQHHRSNSTLTGDGSPLRRFQASVRDPLGRGYRPEPPAKEYRTNSFNNPHPSASSQTSDRSSRSLKPRYGFTKDWLRSHLATQKDNERGNWWSDDSGKSDSEASVANPPETPDPLNPWLEPDLERIVDPLPQSAPPRLDQLLEQEENPFKQIDINLKTTTRHRALPSDVTIKQRDFDELFGRTNQSQPKSTTMLASMHAVPSRAESSVKSPVAAEKPSTMLASMHAVPSKVEPSVKSPVATEKPSSTMLSSIHAVPSKVDSSVKSPIAAEKPLPPPPVNRTVSEAPVLTSGPGIDESLPSLKRPSISSSTSFSRPKRRVVWRGKTCVIALPLDDGTSDSRQYLTAEEREARIKAWEEKGYSVRGFDMAENGDGQLLNHGQSRDIFPDPQTWRQEWQDHNYRVSIPDRKAWDDYVNFLKEEKLRALGVSFGDDEPPVKNSPVMPSLSRQASSQNFIQPPPLSATTMSATSSRSQMGHSFSPSIIDPNLFGRTSPMISPAHQFNPGMIPSHFPKQSISFPNGQFYGPPVQFSMQQQAGPAPAPAGWTQQPYFYNDTGSRGVSPLVNGRRLSLHPSQSPISPLANDGILSEHAAAQRRFPLQSISPNSIQRLPLNQPSHEYRLEPSQPVLSSASRDAGGEVHPVMYISQPEIASPLPQGHRHNPSESLQKEIDSAEYHLEESIRRQLEEDDETSPSSVMNEEPSSQRDGFKSTALRDGFPGLGQKLQTAMSDLETNPSLENSPLSAIDGHAMIPKPSQVSHSSQPSQHSHTSKPSISKLNVNAREFVLDPTKSFAPSMFTFSGNSAAFQNPPMSSAPILETKLSVQKGGTTSSAKSFNVAAPVFTPGAFQAIKVPSREFSFSSTLPTLKPDAPTFKPGAPAFHAASGSDWSGSEKNTSKIFGKFDFAEIAKAGKKSKAIPIVKPEETKIQVERDTDFQEDESGRITQGDGRQKRMRRGGDDGDSVPLFATPTPEPEPQRVEPLAETVALHDNSPLNDAFRGASVVDAASERSLTEQALGFMEQALGLPSNLNIPLPDSPAASFVEEDAPIGKEKEEENDLEPFELKDAAEAANFDLARPRSPTSIPEPEMVEIKPKQLLPESEDQDTTAEREDVTKVLLTATVQPYEYNPDPAMFQFGFDAIPATAMKSRDGLEASRFAPQHTSSEASPATRETEPLREEERSSRPSSVSEDRADNTGGDYLDPSYQEIDEVMKHLNEDSDMGLEKREVVPMRRSSSASTARSAIHSPLPMYQDLSDRAARLSAPGQRTMPSSSPNRLKQPFQYLPERTYGSSDSAAADLIARNARFSPSYKPPKHPIALDSPVHRLNGSVDLPISDWDDVVSSEGEAKLQSRSNFFDHRVNDMIGAIVQKRLQPLEKNLTDMSNSLEKLLIRSVSRRNHRSVSADVENSDADDEDDEQLHERTRSPLRDRKYEKLKASILESLSSQQQTASKEEVTKIQEALADLKQSIEHRKASPSSDIKSTIEEAIAKQMRGKSAPITSSHSAATAEKYQLQIAGLESMLKIAEGRAEDELRLRRLAEDALVDHQRLLRIAQSDAAAQRESAEETERSLRDFHEERLQAAQRYALLEASEAELQKTVSELSKKNSALEDTLEEYRLSSTQWREEIEQARFDNKNLDRTIHALKSELEDGIRGRRALKDKFERLQEEMTTATRNVARDQSLWRRREEEHKARHELQSARLEAEARTRERLEREIERLEAQEKEAMKSRFLVEQVQGENGRLVAMINDLKAENDRAHKEVLHYQRELHNVKETGRLDIQRVQNAMEADMEKASQELQNAKKDHDAAIKRLQTQLEDAKADTVTVKLKYEHMLDDASAEAANIKKHYEHLLEEVKAETSEVKSRYETMLEEAKAETSKVKSRYELMLEEAAESKENALREAAEGREAALQEHYRFHERSLDEMKVIQERAIDELNAAHKRAIVAATEDKDRAMESAREEKRLQETEHKSQLERATEEKRLQEAEHQVRLERAIEEKRLKETEYEARLERAIEEKRLQEVEFKARLEKASEEKRLREAEHKERLERAIEGKRLMEEYHKGRLELAEQEKRSIEANFTGRLQLADDKIIHYHDRVTHLEEKLEIAKAAAQAAVQAAQSARASPNPTIRRPTDSISRGSDVGSKISPQALRESILVLQEQLHERESQIEKLQQDLEAVDKDAPAKIKERDIEISWLRELLGVRIDDLQDIIITLSQPSYDREAVKDAAIRLRANLQMEQQEKERAMAGSGGAQSFPSLSSLSNLTASPRALPFAAAAALGNWGKGRFGSLADMANGSASATPSKSSPQSYLSGLLTPPSTSLRQTPQPSNVRKSSVQSKGFGARYQSTPRQSIDARLSHEPPPETPQLLRHASYDQDAESGHYSLDRYKQEDEESIVGGNAEEDRGNEPFGPNIVS
jgi:hypothetical protein